MLALSGSPTTVVFTPSAIGLLTATQEYSCGTGQLLDPVLSPTHCYLNYFSQIGLAFQSYLHM